MHLIIPHQLAYGASYIKTIVPDYVFGNPIEIVLSERPDWPVFVNSYYVNGKRLCDENSELGKKLRELKYIVANVNMIKSEFKYVLNGARR